MKKEDHNAVPDSVLTMELLSQFKTEDEHQTHHDSILQSFYGSDSKVE